MDDFQQESNNPVWRSWIEKSIKKSRRIKGGNYVQISTVEKCIVNEEIVYKPRNRTVVFRGFTKSNEDSASNIALKMITDSRSNKVKQINENEFGEMVWWFPASSEQFRLQGKYSLITSKIADSWWQNERLETWKKLSAPAKSQFFWPQPGVEYSGLEEGIYIGMSVESWSF